MSDKKLEERVARLEHYASVFRCPACEGFPQSGRPCGSCRGTGRRLYEPVRERGQIGDYWFDFERVIPWRERWRGWLKKRLKALERSL